MPTCKSITDMLTKWLAMIFINTFPTWNLKQNNKMWICKSNIKQSSSFTAMPYKGKPPKIFSQTPVCLITVLIKHTALPNHIQEKLHFLNYQLFWVSSKLVYSHYKHLTKELLVSLSLPLARHKLKIHQLMAVFIIHHYITYHTKQIFITLYSNIQTKAFEVKLITRTWKRNTNKSVKQQNSGKQCIVFGEKQKYNKTRKAIFCIDLLWKIIIAFNAQYQQHEPNIRTHDTIWNIQQLSTSYRYNC